MATPWGALPNGEGTLSPHTPITTTLPSVPVAPLYSCTLTQDLPPPQRKKRKNLDLPWLSRFHINYIYEADSS